MDTRAQLMSEFLEPTNVSKSRHSVCSRAGLVNEH